MQDKYLKTVTEILKTKKIKLILTYEKLPSHIKSQLIMKNIYYVELLSLEDLNTF
jgi:hypothetical protein